MSYTTVARGAENSTDYRIFYKNEKDQLISPWTDIPLRPSAGGNVFNAIIEIPRWTNKKMEIATNEVGNPIKQDTKNGKLRYVKNPFPYQGYIWNYGALPQTWEDPNHVDPNTGAKGDNDPIDICEIGQRIVSPGEVIQVKVLGLFAMIDEGETDWKIMCINVKDPMADVLNDISDIQEHMPGLLDATRDWFTNYKVNDGKPFNEFGFDAQPQNRDFALKIVEETHEFWKNMKDGDNGMNVKRPLADVQAAFEASAQPAEALGLPEDVDKWWYGHVMKK